jgi:Protein of unknown function (DUF3025)
MTAAGWSGADARSGLFDPLRDLLARLPSGWPSTADLQRLADSQEILPRTASGQRIVFVPPAAGIDRPAYEARIFLAGEVEVRPENAHDVFNALVWMAFPLTKAQLNRRHYEALSREPAGSNRGALRDALTVLDESGVIVASSEPALLEHLRAFRWKQLFVAGREQARAQMHFALFGHGLYEKALRPYIGITGHALLLTVDAGFHALPSREQRLNLDRKAAEQAATALGATSDLAPLPLLGVPGWWAANEAPEFYEDAEYFRPGRARPRRTP